MKHKLSRHWNAAKAKVSGFGRDEDGALIIFSLFAVTVMIMIGGIAVDVMLTEEKRTKLQFTIDNAVLAAADLEQSLAIIDVVEGNFRAAGFESVKVIHTHNGVLQQSPQDEAELVVFLNSTQGLNFRRVEATAQLHTNTLFMHWLGIGYLTTPAEGAAEERVTDIEISLVIDISGSMGETSASGDTKLKELKTAARDFFDAVVVDSGDPNALTSVSVIPYNHTVVAGAPLLSKLNAGGGIKTISNPDTNPNGLSTVPTEQFYTTCIDFQDSDFLVTAIGPTTPLERKPHYYWSSTNYNKPSSSQRECDNTRASIMLHQTDKQALKDHVNSAYAGGNTAIDVGMKWGVAALDPAFRQVITGLTTTSNGNGGTVVPAVASGRPADYWDPTTSTDPQDETLKVVVLMTDGQNTTQWTLKDESEYPYIDFKNDRTNVWKFDNWSSYDNNWDSQIGRRLDWYDEYIVRVPDNHSNYEWYRPGSPWTRHDDRWYKTSNLPHGGITQQDWVTLFDRFSYTNAADFFWKKARYNGHSSWEDSLRQKVKSAEKVFKDNAAANQRLKDICQKARDKHILIYAIGFEASSDGVTAMKDCATADGYYFDVDGDEIGTAFEAIANQINQLKLTR